MTIDIGPHLADAIKYIVGGIIALAFFYFASR